MDDEDEMVRAILKLSGRVQGVAFRYYARNKANQLGITGWIRNLDNGDVEAVFEGKNSLVLQMITWCKRGPSLAHVENIDIDWQTYTGEFNQFNIF
ncbi:MAG: acylphosphatase [Candidatus Atribacteria bacterium]|nr:acylphosphatase [Candidatus Atribacteria bacterium]